MATRRSARQSAGPVQAPSYASTSESLDALDGELSDLSDSDVDMGAKSQRRSGEEAVEQVEEDEVPEDGTLRPLVQQHVS